MTVSAYLQQCKHLEFVNQNFTSKKLTALVDSGFLI